VAGYYSATQQHKRRQPRLRGLLALNLAAAAGGAIVFVNSVVIVRSLLGYGDREVAITLGAFGLGSMVAALSLPSLLNRLPDRLIMLTGAGAMTAPLLAAAFALWRLPSSTAWPEFLRFGCCLAFATEC
jgi:predicted MFS family arabinose efflux permease